MAIHNKFDKITDDGREAIRQALDSFTDIAGLNGVKICGDDRIERVAEAMAVCMVESDPTILERGCPPE